MYLIVQRVEQVQKRYSIVPHVPLILLILTVPLVLVPVPHTSSAQSHVLKSLYVHIMIILPLQTRVRECKL